MIPSRTLLLAFLFPVAAACAAEDTVEVLGVMAQAAPAKTLVRLRNGATGVAMWIPMGDTFAGFTVSNIVARNGTEYLMLLKDGRQTQVALAKPKIRNSGPAQQATPFNPNNPGFQNPQLGQQGLAVQTGGNGTDFVPTATITSAPPAPGAAAPVASPVVPPPATPAPANPAAAAAPPASAPEEARTAAPPAAAVPPAPAP